MYKLGLQPTFLGFQHPSEQGTNSSSEIRLSPFSSAPSWSIISCQFQSSASAGTTATRHQNITPLIKDVKTILTHTVADCWGKNMWSILRS